MREHFHIAFNRAFSLRAPNKRSESLGADSLVGAVFASMPLPAYDYFFLAIAASPWIKAE